MGEPETSHDHHDDLGPEAVVVTAQQMQQIETRLFEAGLPVPALMEKVAGQITQWLVNHYPRDRAPVAGIIVGPGHNGGDALVVARELHHQGYDVRPWCPFPQLKPLTAQHKAYLDYLGLPWARHSDELMECDFIVDGGFGIGLTTPLSGELATGIAALNAADRPIVSIDLPSGLDTDSGAALGTAVQATHTLCLGLWKLGLLQDAAQPWIGQSHLIPFDIPQAAIAAVLTSSPSHRRLTAADAIARLPLPRSPIAHKYIAGHTLLIAGSRQYGGAALLAGRGAISSGVGMLTLVVPESLRATALSQLPEALVLGAQETATGAIAALPETVQWDQYDVVACGPGLTLEAATVMEAVWACDRPVLFDADGLNHLSQHDPQRMIGQRPAATLLTPHPGEFRRLFPDLWRQATTPSAAARQAAQAGCTLILKGAISIVAHHDEPVWFNPASTPALARGGSGDVLTGLAAGLAAQLMQRQLSGPDALLASAIAAVWWHAQTGIALTAERSVLGCAASQLASHLPTVLASYL